MIYPTIAKIDQATVLANGFTVSFWAKLPSSQTNFTSLFSINGAIGDIFSLVDIAYRKNGDVFDFDGSLTNVDGGGTHSTGFASNVQGPTNSGFSFTGTEWALITMTYDDATRKISYYGNGVKVPGDYTVPTSVIAASPSQFELITGAVQQVSFGTLSLNPPFTSGPAIDASYQGAGLIGSLDDVRLFDRALSATDIADLYTLGTQHR